MITQEEIKKLIKMATEAREKTFLIRETHKIGSCVLTTEGDYFDGCIIESVIFGLGTCAERAAINHAVVHGQFAFKALAVVDETLTFPCGACLQYLLGFVQASGSEPVIIVADTKGNYVTKKIIDLLPQGYLTKDKFDKVNNKGND